MDPIATFSCLGCFILHGAPLSICHENNCIRRPLTNWIVSPNDLFFSGWPAPVSPVNRRVNNMGVVLLDTPVLEVSSYMEGYLCQVLCFLGCPAPVSPVNGRVSNIGHIARYSCLRGFTLHGSSISVCRGKTRIRTTPVCIRELIIITLNYFA